MEITEDPVTCANDRRALTVDERPERVAIATENPLDDQAVGGEFRRWPGAVDRERGAASLDVSVERDG